jgi:hypothetical protein
MLGPKQIFIGLRPPRKASKGGGVGLRARQAVRTGWKACATAELFGILIPEPLPHR